MPAEMHATNQDHVLDRIERCSMAGNLCRFDHSLIDRLDMLRSQDFSTSNSFEDHHHACQIVNCQAKNHQVADGLFCLIVKVFTIAAAGHSG